MQYDPNGIQRIGQHRTSVGAVSIHRRYPGRARLNHPPRTPQSLAVLAQFPDRSAYLLVSAGRKFVRPYVRVVDRAGSPYIRVPRVARVGPAYPHSSCASRASRRSLTSTSSFSVMAEIWLRLARLSQLLRVRRAWRIRLPAYPALLMSSSLVRTMSGRRVPTACARVSNKRAADAMSRCGAEISLSTGGTVCAGVTREKRVLRIR